MKYKLGEKHPTENLYRIVALKDFANIKEGTVGGWVKGEHNLAQEGNCWVHEDARVYGNARVSEDAQVYGNAWVSEDAQVYGNAWVFRNAFVYGDARVYGNARVSEDSWVYRDAQVSEDAQVKPEWVGLSDDEREHFRKLGFVGVLAVENKLKEKNNA